MLVIERQIGVVPIAEHAQATEAGLLQLDVLDSELIAKLTDLSRGGLVELLGAELLLDLMLDRLAMAVPTGNIGNLIALHHPVAVDHVLGDLVHGVADVDRAVGVRRAVVQHELLVTLVLLQNLLVDLVVLPVLESLGLGLGKTGTHGKRFWADSSSACTRLPRYPFHVVGAHARWAPKKRPSLQAGTKRHKNGLYARKSSSFNHPA